jgi:hypothetical protein
MKLTWNPVKLFGVFSSSTLEYPRNILEAAYKVYLKPMPFSNPKKFKKDLAKLVGPRLEHMIFDDPLLGMSQRKFNDLDEMCKYFHDNFYAISRYNGYCILVCGAHVQKMVEKTPEGFGDLMFSLCEYMGQGSWESRNAVQTILLGYYEAMRLTGKKKEQVKGLPLVCKECDAVFYKEIEDEDGDYQRHDLEIDGTCESCGYLAGKVDTDTLCKAFKYIQQEEIAIGKKIIAA